MKNKELKKDLIKSGVYDDYRYQVFQYRATGHYEESVNPESYNLSCDEYEACKQLRDAKNKTWSRLREHLRFLAFHDVNNLYFVTLTFNDDTLKLSPGYRRKIISKILGKYCDDYIANIDYGAENGREHYHAIIVPKACFKLSEKRLKNGLIHYMSPWLDDYKEKYGFYECQMIKMDLRDIYGVGGYLSKLCNHSIKVKQTKIMTKKGSPYHQWKSRKDKTSYFNPDSMNNIQLATLSAVYDYTAEMVGRE